MDKDYDASLDKKWNPKLFALTDWQKKGEHTFIKALQRMGYHLELWICNEYDLSYEEERKISAELEPDDRPGPAFSELADMDEHFLWPRRMDQITKPEEPWFEHLKQFVDWGADFFKQDGAWQICAHPDRLYGNGMTDAEMHNLYPLLYSRQMWEGFAQYKNRRELAFDGMSVSISSGSAYSYTELCTAYESFVLSGTIRFEKNGTFGLAFDYNGRADNKHHTRSFLYNLYRKEPKA
jgi:hypothetical protein